MTVAPQVIEAMTHALAAGNGADNLSPFAMEGWRHGARGGVAAVEAARARAAEAGARLSRAAAIDAMAIGIYNAVTDYQRRLQGAFPPRWDANAEYARATWREAARDAFAAAEAPHRRRAGALA